MDDGATSELGFETLQFGAALPLGLPGASAPLSLHPAIGGGLELLLL